MKKYLFGLTLILGALLPLSFTQAAGLTSEQISQIVSLLDSFNVDQATITRTLDSLTGSNTPGSSAESPSSTGSLSSAAPTASITVNGGQKSVMLNPGDSVTTTWQSTNGSAYDATWSATGTCSDAGLQNQHWTWFNGKNPAGDTETHSTAGKIGCTYTITYTVKSATGQTVSSSVSFIFGSSPSASNTPATGSCDAVLNAWVDAHTPCQNGQGVPTQMVGNACQVSGASQSCTDCAYLSASQRTVGYNAITCANTAPIQYEWAQQPAANFGPMPPTCASAPTVGGSCATLGSSCVSTDGKTMYTCQDTRTTAGVGYSGKVVDENGNALSGVTVSLYVGGPVNLQVDTKTDANGNWSFQMAGSTTGIYHFAWFHNKQGYDSTGRIALTAGGSQGTYVMKTLQPLSIFPSTVNLPRQGMARASLTLNNFDNENDITDADLQICAVQNATSCTNFVDYQTYLNNGYLNRTDPFPFVYLNNHSNTVTFVYDNVDYSNLSGINNVFYALRRKSNPANVTTGLLKLYSGTYTWTLSATNNTARDKTSVWALPTCSSVGASVGASCSVLSVGSTCAIDDSATSWRQLNCELAGNTAQPVTMVPSYSQMSMATKLPVQIAVNGIPNPTTNTKVCSEVLAQPNVPSAVDAGKCSDLANFYSFSGNSDWTPTLNGWIGNIKYDPSIYGAVGIQVKSYFMNAATGGYAGSTIEVVGGTAAISPTQTNPSSTTAQIQWNSGGSGGTYITNIDPTSVQTLSWHSTNADTLVKMTASFTGCENPASNRVLDPWAPWSGGVGNAFGGSSVNSGNANDAGCHVTATYIVKNSVTGSYASAYAYLSYMGSASINLSNLPGGLSYCPTNYVGALSCDASGEQHETIKNCVPTGYDNPALWNWTKTPINTWDHLTGNVCSVSTSSASASPSSTLTLTASASPNPATYGGNTIVTWSSTGASFCTMQNVGVVPTSGTMVVGPIFAYTNRAVVCTQIGPPLQIVTKPVDIYPTSQGTHVTGY